MLKLLFILIFLGLLSPTISITCHYSCATCTTEVYSACRTCHNGTLFYKTLSNGTLQGTCLDIENDIVTALGVIYLILVFVAGIVVFNEEIIYLILFAQSLGLMYLVEVHWTPVLDYIFESLTFLMVFSRISYASKTDNNQYGHPQIIKGHIFMRQLDLQQNIEAVGVANILVIVLMLLIMILKAIRKRLTKDRVHFLPDWVLTKINIALAISFIFMIQESMTVIYFSLRYGTITAAAVVISIIYIIVLILFSINQFTDPLPVFRNKGAQLNIILGKSLVSLFLTLPTTVHYMAFLFLLLTWIADLILTHKNRNKKEMNRLLGYKIIGLVTLVVIIVFYFVQLIANNQKTTFILGIIGAIVVCFDIHLILVQCGVQIKRSVFPTNQRLQKSLQKSRSRSSSQSQQSKKKKSLNERFQQTLENIKQENRSTIFDQRPIKKQITAQQINLDFQVQPPIMSKQNSLTPIKQFNLSHQSQSDPQVSENQPEFIANFDEEPRILSVRPKIKQSEQDDSVRYASQVPQASPQRPSQKMISEEQINHYSNHNRQQQKAVQNFERQQDVSQEKETPTSKKRYKKRKKRAN